MRVFITGIAGFIGSHLAEAFLARGDRVCGIDNLIGGYRDNVPRGADWTVTDCNDFEKVKKALRGVDVVYHCAATAHEGLSVFSPAENTRHGYMASATVFSAAAAVRVPRIVHCTSMARYGKGNHPPPFTEETTPIPEDPYGIGKLASEHLLRNIAETHGLEYVIAVPHNVVGRHQVYTDPFRNAISIFANLMLQGRQPVIYGDGEQQRSFSAIQDAIGPLVTMSHAANVVGEVINIGPDKEVVTVKHAAELVAKEIGVPFNPIYKPGRPREVKFAHCSADKARRLLGYEPRVSLEQIIHETVEWIRKRGVAPFAYDMLNIEIENERLPETWAKRLF